MFEFSRRELVLSAATAGAAFGLNKPIAFIGAAHAQQLGDQTFRTHKVGDIEVFAHRWRRRSPAQGRLHQKRQCRANQGRASCFGPLGRLCSGAVCGHRSQDC
jgi:hypothetical protein